MNCTACSASSPLEARFCMACGAPLRSETANSPTSAIDNLRKLAPRQYVDRLLSEGDGAAAERRVVTILFADVVGSTAMAETLDPEDVMEIMNGAFAVLIEPIVRYEGTVARLMGDGVLSFFGAPVAHEEDPERACTTALEILRNAREYGDLMAARYGISRFDVRVGVNTGLVVVGEVGGLARVEYTAMGDAVNLASRIQSAAEPGTALITGKTYDIVRDKFDVEDKGTIRVRGKSEPVRAYRLLRKTPRPSRAASAGDTPLIGRARELQLVLEAINNACRGSGGLITIVGEPGVGKTRLLAESRALCSRRVNWVGTKCSSYSVDMAYAVIREMVSDLFGIDPTTSTAEAVEHVKSELARMLPGDFGSDRLPEVAALLQLPLADGADKPSYRDDPQLLRSRIINTVCDIVRSKAQELPVVFVLDDLQWADHTSFEVLGELMRATKDAAVLYVAMHRSADSRVDQLLERIRSGESISSINIVLSPLDDSDASHMLDVLLSGHDVSDDHREYVLGCAEGNPFILEEVSRSLLEPGFVPPGSDRIGEETKMNGTNLSTKVHGVIMARLDCLAPSQRRLLLAASTIGRYFRQDVLAETDGRPESLDVPLGELEKRDFIYPVGGSTSDGIAVPGSATVPVSAASLSEGTHAFRHPMTSEVLYGSMLNPQRQSIHLRVAEAMERLYRERARELAPILAFHYEQAGVADKAFDYLVLAARAAAEICANPEAIGLYRRALTLAESAGLTNAEVTSTHEHLGDIYFVVGEYAAAMDQYAISRSLAQTPSQLATINRKEGQACLRWGKYETAQKHYEAALEQLRECPEDAAAAHVCAGLGLVYWHQGEFDAAIQMETLALSTMETLEDYRGIATVCNSLGVMYARNEEWEQAQAFHKRALTICSERGFVYDIAAVLNNMGLAAHRRGDPRKAVDYFEKSLEQFDRVGNKHGLACALDNMSQAYLDLDDTDRAADYLLRAVTILKEIGMDRSEIVPEMWKSGEW